MMNRKDPQRYITPSRCTDPGDHISMFDGLPDDPEEMCGIVRAQIVHYLMLSQWRVPVRDWKHFSTAGPCVEDLLASLKRSGPKCLSPDRGLSDRVLGSCVKDSILLTAMLRHKAVPARIRAGYLANLYKGETACFFWKNFIDVGWYGFLPKPAFTRAFLRRAMTRTFLKGMAQWVSVKAMPQRHIRRDQTIGRTMEHWICEYWDAAAQQWRLLDARSELLAAFGIDVGCHLPEEYFEYPWRPWLAREEAGFNPARYAQYLFEPPFDGLSHVRQQLLYDFYSLLNFDLVGHQEAKAAFAFIRRRRYADLTGVEFEELDRLALLMGRDPCVEELVEFYRKSVTLKLEAVERDPFGFVGGDASTGCGCCEPRLSPRQDRFFTRSGV